MMHVGTDHNPPSLPTLVTRLGELGWFDGPVAPVMQQLIGDGNKVQGKMAQLSGEYQGSRIDLIWRNLDPAQVEDQAKQFVDQRVDVIVAFEDKSIRAAQDATAAATDRIPVVFLHPSDPVRDGLVTSLSAPGGNLTGVFGARDPITAQVQLYKQIIPGLKTLYAFVDPTDTATAPLYAQAADAAAQLGITLVKEEASDDAGLQQVFSSLPAADGTTGAFLVSPSLRLNHSAAAIADSVVAKLPVQAHRKEWVQDDADGQGGEALFSLGVDVGPVGTAGANFVDGILRGKAPADLAVQEVPKVEFALSLKRAADLGLTVPPDVITQAEPLVYR
jgi:putative ABC transport system substrate-binding protein